MGQSLTGPSCHRSPDNMRFSPPNMRGCCRRIGFRYAYGCLVHALVRKKDSNVPSKPSESVLTSSITTHRMLMQFSKSWSQSTSLLACLAVAAALLVGMTPQLCTVVPPIKAAIEFCAAKYWNWTPCFQPITFSKKSRINAKHKLLPAPGMPNNAQRQGSESSLQPRSRFGAW